ncbi:hypothetical protein RHGRI_038485 [Rhododendron griersonianum]|uniref:Leucine zipper homeobox-associated domain-containing protein n=1 Tax=Rhododendron griersonianum TaxID=479676 RepID=A0AAV6HJ20_9ERIC|nr:hypothetical protein RHGRI_038485 [Rhododendron griersonianum]
MQTEIDCEFLKRCCETLTEENRRLQKEVQELRALKLSPQFNMQMTPPTTLTMCPSCERVAASPSPSSSSSGSPPVDSPRLHQMDHDGWYRTKLKKAEIDCEFLKTCCENLTCENRRSRRRSETGLGVPAGVAGGWRQVAESEGVAEDVLGNLVGGRRRMTELRRGSSKTSEVQNAVARRLANADARNPLQTDDASTNVLHFESKPRNLLSNASCDFVPAKVTSEPDFMTENMPYMKAFEAFVDIMKENLAHETAFVVATQFGISGENLEDISNSLRKLDRLIERSRQWATEFLAWSWTVLKTFSPKQVEAIYTNRDLQLPQSYSVMDQVLNSSLTSFRISASVNNFLLWALGGGRGVAVKLVYLFLRKLSCFILEPVLLLFILFSTPKTIYCYWLYGEPVLLLFILFSTPKTVGEKRGSSDIVFDALLLFCSGHVCPVIADCEDLLLLAVWRGVWMRMLLDVWTGFLLNFLSNFAIHEHCNLVMLIMNIAAYISVMGAVAT